MKDEKRRVRESGGKCGWAVFALALVFGVAGVKAQIIPHYLETAVKDVDGNGSDVVSRTYADGLGRVLQSQTKSNGTAFDIVTGTEYDEAGRPVKTAKPFPYSRTQQSLFYLNFDIIAGANGANAYFNGEEGRPNAEGFAYSETRYYDDPLGRVKSSGAPGKNYSIDQHPAKSWYFGVSGSGSSSDQQNCFDDFGFIKRSYLASNYESNLETVIPSNGSNYHLSVTRDQNGNFSQEMTDLFGNTVRSWSCSDLTNNNSVIVSVSTHDVLGQLLTEQPPATEGRQNVGKTEYRYNTLGLVEWKKTPDANEINYAYDGANRMFSVKDANGTKSKNTPYELRYSYDPAGRNTAISKFYFSVNSSSIRIRNVYDVPEDARTYLANSSFPAGSGLDDIMTGLSNTSGRLVASIAYDDDLNGLVVKNEEEYTGKVIDLFSYNADGQVCRKYKSVPGVPLQKVKFGYDLHGKLLADTIESADPSFTPVITSYGYDRNGRLSSVSRNGALYVSYTYDALGKMTSKWFRKGEQICHPIDYKYSIRDWLDTIKAYDQDYVGLSFFEAIYYDRHDDGSIAGFTPQYNGNIARAVITTQLPAGTVNPGGALDLLYSYDGANRLTGVSNRNGSSPNDYNAAYSYLNDGRFLTKKEGTKQQDWGNYAYYNQTNQLKHIAGSKTKMGDDDNPNYIYDLNGNMVLDRSKSMSIEYDWRNLPVQFNFHHHIPPSVKDWMSLRQMETRSGLTKTQTIRMLYDAAGNRVLKEDVPPLSTRACPNEQNQTDPALMIMNTVTGTEYHLTSGGTLESCKPIVAMDAEIGPPDSALVLKTEETPKIAFTSDNIQVQGVFKNNAESSEPGDLTGTYVPAPPARGGSQCTFSAASGSMQISGQIPLTANPSAGVAYIDGSHTFEFDVNSQKYHYDYANVKDEGRTYPDGRHVFYIKDHLGSTRMTMDENWQPQEATAYFAYGAERSLIISSTKTREKFTGKERDDEGPVLNGIVLSITISASDLIAGTQAEINCTDAFGKIFRDIIPFTLEASSANINRTIHFPGERILTYIKFVIRKGTAITNIYVRPIDEFIESRTALKIEKTIPESDIGTGGNFEKPKSYVTMTTTESEERGMGLVYFGARYYDPEIGVWTSIDPAEQMWNSYSFSNNNPVISVDPDGMENIVVVGNQGYSPQSDKRYRKNVNQRHFLERGYNEADHLQKFHRENDEITTMIVYRGNYKKTELDYYRDKAQKAGMNFMVAGNTTQIVDYVNNKGIYISEAPTREDDLVTDFSYVGHGIKYALLPGYNAQQREVDNDPLGTMYFEKSAFHSSANANLEACGSGFEVFNDFKYNLTGGTVTGYPVTVSWASGKVGEFIPVNKEYTLPDPRLRSSERVYVDIPFRQRVESGSRYAGADKNKMVNGRMYFGIIGLGKVNY